MKDVAAQLREKTELGCSSVVAVQERAAAGDIDGAYALLKGVYEFYVRKGQEAPQEYVEIHIHLLKLEAEAAAK